jgi:hypothetical protein
METKIYGCSDDLIEIEGHINDEIGCYGTDEKERGVLIVGSDGTALEVKYGKGGMGIWGITLLRQGPLFERVEPCTDEEADPYSDVAYFKDGMKSFFVAKNWEYIK